ncbi:hypothetical protein [Streptomyces sp. NPDC051183]|uniref:hypothetical protein n=1 Tax=Streptomyces sp. NPDC051183 TaxID=3155165 RepID=UPI00343FABA5
MHRQAYDLTRLTRTVTESDRHPGGVCTQESIRCYDCRMPAPIAFRFGGPMADCRPCGYAWAVRHDPAHCWQRQNITRSRPNGTT